MWILVFSIWTTTLFSLACFQPKYTFVPVWWRAVKTPEHQLLHLLAGQLSDFLQESIYNLPIRATQVLKKIRCLKIANSPYLLIMNVSVGNISIGLVVMFGFVYYHSGEGCDHEKWWVPCGCWPDPYIFHRVTGLQHAVHLMRVIMTYMLYITAGNTHFITWKQ